MRWFLNHLGGPLLALILLAGVFGTQTLHQTPRDAGDYHERVQTAVDDVPYVIGDWLGRDVPVPAEAAELLQPNAILSREYVHTRTRERVQLVLVHCLDARDLQGHYPPVCYPGIGWRLTDRDTRSLPIGRGADAATHPVAHYRFQRLTTTGTEHLKVLNLMVLPDGSFGTDMQPVDRAAGSHTLRHLGAAQLQLLPGPDTDPERQAELWATFYDAFKPALDAIQRGGDHADAD